MPSPVASVQRKPGGQLAGTGCSRPDSVQVSCSVPSRTTGAPIASCASFVVMFLMAISVLVVCACCGTVVAVGSSSEPAALQAVEIHPTPSAIITTRATIPNHVAIFFQFHSFSILFGVSIVLSFSPCPIGKTGANFFCYYFP